MSCIFWRKDWPKDWCINNRRRVKFLSFIVGFFKFLSLLNFLWKMWFIFCLFWFLPCLRKRRWFLCLSLDVCSFSLVSLLFFSNIIIRNYKFFIKFCRVHFFFLKFIILVFIFIIIKARNESFSHFIFSIFILWHNLITLNRLIILVYLGILRILISWNSVIIIRNITFELSCRTSKSRAFINIFFILTKWIRWNIWEFTYPLKKSIGLDIFCICFKKVILLLLCIFNFFWVSILVPRGSVSEFLWEFLILCNLCF